MSELLPALVDERGSKCPVPVIALAKAAAAGSSLIDLLADDPVADIDVAAWCLMTGNTLESRTPLPDEQGSGVRYRVIISAHTPR